MPLPLGFVPPCLPTKAQQPPTGEAWLHEIKHNGFRVVARKDGTRVKLYSRPRQRPHLQFEALAWRASCRSGRLLPTAPRARTRPVRRRAGRQRRIWGVADAVRELRSTGTKARTDVDRLRASNAELEKKLAEALEQQTATSEVLRVISSSPGNLQAVFQAMLENATRVCGAEFGVLWLPEREGFRAVALHGVPSAFAEARRREPWVKTNPGTSLGRVAATKQTVQIVDIRQEPAYISDPSRFAPRALAPCSPCQC
jgi:GAF domain